jgi:hypothetical protein
MDATTTTNKRKREDDDIRHLVVIGITSCISTRMLCTANELVVAPLLDACSYTFKDGSTIDATGLDADGPSVIITKVINPDDIRSFVTHCRGNIKLNDHDKVPKTTQLFINHYNSRKHNSNLPRRKQVHALKGRVVGFINLFTNESTHSVMEEVDL